MGKKYLGLGPSAHSFDGISRRWNVAHVESYINSFASNTDYFEEEKLSEKNRYNEYILTRIRTKWGVSQDFISKEFGEEKADYFAKQIKKHLIQENAVVSQDFIKLTRDGLFISDEIMADLMIV